MVLHGVVPNVRFYGPRWNPLRWAVSLGPSRVTWVQLLRPS